MRRLRWGAFSGERGRAENSKADCSGQKHRFGPDPGKLHVVLNAQMGPAGPPRYPPRRPAAPLRRIVIDPSGRHHLHPMSRSVREKRRVARATRCGSIIRCPVCGSMEVAPQIEPTRGRELREASTAGTIPDREAGPQLSPSHVVRPWNMEQCGRNKYLQCRQPPLGRSVVLLLSGAWQKVSESLLRH